MTSCVVSPQAENDLFEIWRYLVDAANVEFADQVEAELFDNFARLSRNPGLGHKREDLTEFPVLFYRAFPHPYMIIYRQGTLLEIVAVLHARRDVAKLLEHRQQP